LTYAPKTFNITLIHHAHTTCSLSERVYPLAGVCALFFEVAMPSKPFWESKVFWVNLVMAVIAILELATDALPLPEGSGVWLVFIIGVLNIVLRFVTVQPVSLTDEKRE
jgi:hypothetical protein